MKAILMAIALAAPISGSALSRAANGYNVECMTSWPQSQEGIKNMILRMTQLQINKGFTAVVSTTVTKAGSADMGDVHGEVVVCVTAKK